MEYGRKGFVPGVWALTVGIAAAQGGAGGAAAPGEGTGAETNIEIVVTASRNDRPSHRMPRHVSVIRAEDIERAGYANIVEALEKAGGLTFRSTSGNASQAEIQLRGFGENSHGRVLVLLDGQKLNRPDMASLNWLEIPLSNVERVEILRGANSALYGDHAVGGVINILTRKGSKEPAITARADAGSYGANTERLGFTGTSGSLAYALNAEHQGEDGFRARSAWRAWGAGGSLSYDVDEALNAVMTLSYHSAGYEMPGGLTRAQWDADARQSVYSGESATNRLATDEAEVDQFTVGLAITGELDEASRLRLGLSYGRKNLSTDMPRYGTFSDGIINSVGISPNGVFSGRVLGRTNRLLVGADYARDQLALTRYANDGRTAESGRGDVTKTVLGAFAHDEFGLCETWTLGAGARLERAEIRGRAQGAGTPAVDDEKTHNRRAVDLSVSYAFAPRSKAFARFNTVYRYPFVDEQVSYSGYGDTVYTNLEAETGYGVEAGAEWAVSSSVSAGLTAFLMRMKDEINYNMERYQNENMDRTRRQGLEATMVCAVSRHVTLDAAWSYTEALFTAGPNDGKEVPLVPRHTATLNASASVLDEFTVRAGLRYVGSSYLGGDYANASEKLPAYTVADVLLRYTPRGMEGFDAFVAVDNVLNESYATVGYRGYASLAFYPAPERSYRAGVSYRF